MKKKNYLLIFILMFIIGKTVIVNAETYNVTLDGVDYICESKSISTGNGQPKSSFPSREQARIECEQNQRNYINGAKEIFIFDDPSTCTFEEKADIYNCNCRATTYRGCKKTNSNQNPTYNEPHTIEVKFMNESGIAFSERSCNVTSSNHDCQVTFPLYNCSNNMTFLGWSSKQGDSCSNLIDSGTTLYFGSSGKIHTYWTYYPCCRSKSNTYVTPNITPTSIPTSPSITDNNSSNNNEEINNNPVATIEPTTNNNNTPVEQNNESEKTNKTTNYLVIILIIVLAILIAVVIALIIFRKKNRNNNNDNNNDNDTFDSNNYYY